MRILHSIAALALVLCPISAQAADKPPIALAKTTKWEINYDQDSCHLLARFGAGKQEVLLKLTSYQPGPSFDLTLIGNPARISGPIGSVEIGFAPTYPMVERNGVAGTSAKKVPLAIVTTVRVDGWTSTQVGSVPPEITPAQEAAVSALDFAARGKTYRLDTGSMGKPMAAMRDCLTDLVGHWGFNAAVQASLSRPVSAVGNPGDWLRPADYPMKSINSGHNGLVQYRLDVDPSGQVSGCRVLFRTNPDEFADRTCDLLAKRAKLEPALDSAGLAVKSFYIGKVRWFMEGS